MKSGNLFIYSNIVNSIQKIGIFIVFIFTISCNKNVIREDNSIKHTDIQTNISTDLNTVFFADLKTGYIAGDSGLIFKTNDGALSWSNISLPNKNTVNSIQFKDHLLGIAGTSNGIMRTDDGGNTWIQTLSNYRVNEVFIIENTTKVIATGNKNTKGYIWKSEDNGISWVSVSLPGSVSILNAVHFTHKDTGFIAGNQYCLLETTNGGNTWTFSNPKDNEDITDIYFTSYKNGYLITESGSIIHKIDKSTSIVNEEISYPIHGIKFKNNIGIAVGKKTVYSIDVDMIAEKDEGFYWNYMLKSDATSFQNTYLDVCFASPEIAFAVGENGIMTKFIFNL